MSKYTEEDIKNICSNLGHTYVNGWIRTNKKFICICACGQVWSVYLHNMLRGGACKKCTGYSLQTIKDFCQELGHTYISGWTNIHKKINCICACGELWSVRLDSLLRGTKCKKCAKYGPNPLAENEWIQYFKAHGCEVTCYKSSTNISYKCHCGELHTIDGHQFKIIGKNCPKCNIHWNYNPNKLPDRGSLHSWKKAVVIRDNFECQICGLDESLEIHHIDAYSVKPELMSDINNGITLCYTCHKQIHRKYGMQVGIENLQKELKL